MSEYHYFLFLKIDLMGIGVMIFGLTLAAVYIGFHSYEFERDWIMLVMGSLMVSNLLIQMTPCYADERFNCHRIVFYVCALMVCLALAISGRFYYATNEEVSRFYG